LVGLDMARAFKHELREQVSVYFWAVHAEMRSSCTLGWLCGWPRPYDTFTHGARPIRRGGGEVLAPRVTQRSMLRHVTASQPLAEWDMRLPI